MKKYVIIVLVLVLNINFLTSKNDIIKGKLNGKEVSYVKNMGYVTFQYALKDYDKNKIERNLNIKILNPLLNEKQSIKNNVKTDLELLSSNNQLILKTEDPLLRTYLISFEANNPMEFLKNLRKNSSIIKYAEFYEVPQLLYKPNDPRISNQIFLDLIKAYDLWDVEKGNPNIIIGISDSGVDQDHEDIKSNLAVNAGEIPYDNIDNDNNGYVDDYSGYNFAYNSDGVNPNITVNEGESHGLQVAGLASAATDNSKGIAGVGFNSKIFPIKIMEKNSLVYAYQSIIYAATRGVKVLNLSWGSPKSPSDIDQIVIDYAVSRDVAIVASAGNVGSGNSNTYSTFYPANYKGVLGIGEVAASGQLTSESILGVGTRLMAPGEGSWTVGPGSSYSVCDGGSSFSSPIVAGAVALARAKYPELNAIQSIEFVRQCADTFLTQESKYYKLTPGILNMKKIADINPFSIPSIRPENIVYYDNDGNQTERYEQGAFAKITVKSKNYLGAANNLKFVLSEAYDPSGSIDVIDSIFNIGSIEQNSNFDINDFKIAILQNNSSEVILRVDIYGENGYRDFFKFGFIPYQQVTTFSNDNFFITLADNGEIGFFTEISDTGVGKGLGSKNDGNQIYQNSTIMVSEYPNENEANVLFNDWEVGRFDFKTLKKFSPPNSNIGIISDEYANTNRMNIEITQEVNFLSQTSSSVQVKLQIKNTGDSTLSNIAMGYYTDWDVAGDPENNKTEYFPVGVPSGKINSSAVQIAYKDDSYPIYGSGIISNYSNVTPQAAGLNYSYFQDFEPEERIATLNSGKSMQINYATDISSVIGIRFNGNFAPNETRECIICIARGESKQEFASVMKDCLSKIVSVSDEDISTIELFPNPALDFIRFNSNNEDEYSIYSILGVELIRNKASIGNNTIDVSNLSSGFYVIKIGDQITKFIKK